MRIPDHLTFLLRNLYAGQEATVQFSSVTQSCPTLCNSMDCSAPRFPIHHQLLELAQTYVHPVGDAIQLSSSVLPFSSCLQSFPASESFLMSRLLTSGGQSIGASASASVSFQMSQLFASGSQSIGVLASTSVVPMNIQDWSPLGWTGWISLQSKGFLKVFSNTAVQKHQFFSAQLSLWSNSCIHTWIL